MTFSAIENTKCLFVGKIGQNLSADSILLAYVLWTFIARSYLSPLYIRAIGLKNVFNSIPNHIALDPGYFWIRSPFPNETLLLTR